MTMYDETRRGIRLTKKPEFDLPEQEHLQTEEEASKILAVNLDGVVISDLELLEFVAICKERADRFGESPTLIAASYTALALLKQRG